VQEISTWFCDPPFRDDEDGCISPTTDSLLVTLNLVLSSEEHVCLCVYADGDGGIIVEHIKAPLGKMVLEIDDKGHVDAYRVVPV